MRIREPRLGSRKLMHLGCCPVVVLGYGSLCPYISSSRLALCGAEGTVVGVRCPMAGSSSVAP